MSTKKLFPLIAAFIFSLSGFAQDFKKQFSALSAAKDTAGQIALLRDWEKKTPDDPELYVSYFSYYVWKSKLEYKAPQEQQNKKEDKVIKLGGAAKREAGYDPGYLKMGLTCVDKGIAKFPDRLDLRFGKIYMLGETKNYKAFTDEILKTIDYSSKNKNAWLWSDNVPKKDGKEFFMQGLQHYVVQLYNTNNDTLMENIKQISERVLKYYPDRVESLSNVGMVYLMRKEYDKALKPLLKAEKLMPNDYVVLSNIAQVYKEKGDKSNAIKYYERILKDGGTDAKKIAQDELDALKKQ